MKARIEQSREARVKEVKEQAAAILEIRKGIERFKDEPEEAFISYLELLETAGINNPKVQYSVANHYIGSKDNERAVPWLQKGAAQSHVESMSMLGLRYLRGLGCVAANPEEGMRLLLSAEKLGSVTAPYFLGVEMKYGNTIPRNDQGAARWFRQVKEGTAQELLRWEYFSPLAGREHNAKFYLYHTYMLQADYPRIVALLQQHQEDVMTEILFDLGRSLHSKNDSLYACMQNLIAVIRFTPGTDLDYFNQMLDSFYQDWVLNVKIGDVLSVKGMNIFFERLQELDLKTIPTNKIISLIESATGTWNRVVSSDDSITPDYAKVVVSCTDVIADCLPTLLHRLQVEKVVLDDSLSKQCAIILLKAALGNEYCLSGNSITCQDLMMILQIIKDDRILPAQKVEFINLVCQQTVLMSIVDKAKLKEAAEAKRTSVAGQGMFTREEKGKGEAEQPSPSQ